MSSKITPFFPIYHDIDGDPLDSGYIYIGQSGLNPEVNPINVFWDAALTIPAAQPIRTLNGYPSRSGSAAAMYVAEAEYSITIRNRNGSLITSTLTDTNAGQSIQVISSKSSAKTIAVVSTRQLWMDSSYWEPVTGAAPGTYSDDSVSFGTIVVPTSGDGSACWRRVRTSKDVYAVWYGAVGDDSTDNQTAIDEALILVRAIKGNLVFTSGLSTAAIYQHSGTIYYNGSEVGIVGEGTGVQLKYTGVGTALQINTNPTSDPARERPKLRNISLVSSTGAVCFDWTGANYGIFEDYEMAYTATNAILHKASGNGNGTGSYFNKFDGLSLFGGSDRSQTAFQFDQDSSGNLADGPNANEFSNIKRMASFSKCINLKSGTGNMFTNISAESVKDAMIILNDLNSLADSGTSTSTTTNTLVDTAKTWSVVVGDTLNFTNGAVIIKSGPYAGETRRIISNSVDTLTLDKPWPDDIGAAVSYWIYKGKAVKNLFVNIRQEGLASDNPDCIRLIAGSGGNEFSQIEAGSLGTGKSFDDQSSDPSNQVRQGDLVTKTFIVENPGPGATIELIPRSGVLGGLQNGSNIVLEYLEVSCPNFVVGSAEAVITVDQGGGSTGAGDTTLTAKINDYNTNHAFCASRDKVSRSASNKPIFAQIATNANVNASSDFIINLCYRVA